MLEWFKSNVIALAAVLISLTTIYASNLTAHVEDSARLKRVEETLQERKGYIQRFFTLEQRFEIHNAEVTAVEKRLKQVEGQQAQTDVTLAELNKTLLKTQGDSRVINTILVELTGTVQELTTTTKQLTDVVTQVAVLDQRVTHLEGDK